MLTTQKPTPPVPNAVIVSNVMLVTTIAGGKLLTRANLALEPANVANAGTPQETWVATGPALQVTLPNLASLPPDLAACAPQIAAASAAVEAAVGAINAVRKLA